MKSQARVVIVGGGIMGVGLLYHLVEEGWSDVVLVEKGELTSGSTWHAAGQCPHFNGSLNLTKMHVYGTELYPRLEALTGVAVSWHGCGGVRLAVTEDEVDWFKYVHGLARLAGYEAEIVGPNQVKTYHPLVETFGVKAAYITFTDGHVAPADITNAMAAGARRGGATIHRRCRATDIRRLPSGEWEVVTERGTIRCEHVVNAAGSYADVVGAWTGHTVPIANLLHHYVITEPLQELIDRERELPVLRDPWSHCYMREETNGVLVGPYETAGAHVCFGGGPPAWDFESELVPPELERLMPWLEKAGERLPLFNRAGIKSVVSGAITHTPDSNFLLGPAHGAPGYWMANGASIGICQGAGAGKYLAQWMVHGQAEINMREFDPRRFGALGRRRLCEGHRHRGLSSHVLLLPARRAACGGPAGAPVEPVRASRRGRGAVPAGHGLGASALVRQKRCGRALFLPPQQLVAGGARGMPGGAQRGRAHGPVELRQIRAPGHRRAGDAVASLRQPHSRPRWRHRARPYADRCGLHRERAHHHPAGWRPLFPAVGRHRRAAGRRPVAPGPAVRRRLHARQCHRGLWHARPCRTALARGPRAPSPASISATPPSPG